jgi:hypothetical protein
VVGFEQNEIGIKDYMSTISSSKKALNLCRLISIMGCIIIIASVFSLPWARLKNPDEVFLPFWYSLFNGLAFCEGNVRCIIYVLGVLLPHFPRGLLELLIAVLFCGSPFFFAIGGLSSIS